MKSDKLKICPFCGKKPKFIADGGSKWYKCKCGLITPEFTNEEDLIKYWNTRI